MATVTVVVNGRPYGVGCEDGQESHVEALARDFDQQVRDVGGQVGQVGDLRLFLMAALVTADELSDTKLQLAQARSQLAAGHAPSVSTSAPPPADHRAVEAIIQAADRIETMAAKLG